MEILLYIENRHFLELSYERLDHQARINRDSFAYGFQNQNFWRVWFSVYVPAEVEPFIFGEAFCFV